MPDSAEQRHGPQDLRRSLSRYVKAVHDAYVDTAQLRATDPALMPLADAPFTVAAIAADQLHIVATREPLPPVAPHEQPIADQSGPLYWQVRFFDVTVLPELATTPRTSASDVLDVLGVSHTLYNLVVTPAATLDGHQALHTGTGLANAHLGERR